jgi:hypothetical protein
MKPVAWIVVGVLLVINVGIRLPGVRKEIQRPLVARSYGSTTAGFSLAFPTALSIRADPGVGSVYAGSADNGRLAVGVTVSRLAGSVTSRSAAPHPVCAANPPELATQATPSVSVVSSPSYCLENLVAVHLGTVFSVTVLSSEGPDRAEAVSDSFHVR